MASFKSLSVIPTTDCDAFRKEVELFNLHSEFNLDSYTLFIYEGRGLIENQEFDGPIDKSFLNNGIESKGHLHVSLDGSGEIRVRGNLDLGNLVNLDLEITRGFSFPVDSIHEIKDSTDCFSIIQKIVTASYANNGEGPDEYIEDEQVTFSAEPGSYTGVFSSDSSVDIDETAQSYSMILRLPVASQDLIGDMLLQLGEAFDELEIEYFIAGSTSDGDYEDGSPLVGPEARLDASFGDVELYIVDDEICIEGS